MQKQYRTARVILAVAGMVMTAAMTTRAADPDPRLAIKDLDLDGDGSITAAELVTAGEAEVKELQANFLAKYDSIPAGQTAGDGIITTAEAKAVFEARAADWLEHVLETFDTNDDGAISDADVPAGGKHRPGRHHLEAYDTDDDGVVSAAELEAAAAEQAADQLAKFLARYDSIPAGEKAGDGVITAAESLAVHRELVADRIEAFLDRFDTNDDGAVSAAELGVKPARGQGAGKGKPVGPGGHR